MLLIRSIIFFIGQALITLIYFPLTLLAIFLPNKKKVSLISGWGWLVIKWLKLSCGLDYSIKGMENIPDQPFIALVNHQSAWETTALLFLLPPHCWVLKKELLRIPVFGWGLALAKPIAIDRTQNKAALKQLLVQGKDRLESGLCVVICPQGTRMRPGEFGRFNVGGAMLAVRSKVPVVPITHNSGSFWPRKGFLKYPGTVEVIVGQAIMTDDKSADKVNNQAREWIETTLTHLETGNVNHKETTLENKPELH